MLLKDYQVFYELKYGKQEETRHIFIRAKNQKEAKEKAQVAVMSQTGKYAFRCRFTPEYRK